MQNQSVQQANISIMSSFSGSKKVYAEGSSPDIRVPMREISLSATTGAFGEEENAPVRVYDTSGPYTDPDVQIDIHEGLGALRTKWITGRGDVDEYNGRTVRPEDNGYKKRAVPLNTPAYSGNRFGPSRGKM